LAGQGLANYVFKEPPEDWELEQYDQYINYLIRIYRGVSFFMKTQDEERFNAAEKLFEKIWLFRDLRLAKFPSAKDNWLLVEDF
jgi:hypothetical protein